MPRVANPQSLKNTPRLLPQRPNPNPTPQPAPNPKAAAQDPASSAAAYLRTADDRYLRLSLAALAKIHAQLQRLEATLTPYNRRLPPAGVQRQAIPAYTVRGLRGSTTPTDADYVLPGMLAVARSRGEIVRENLEDLLAVPYPAGVREVAAGTSGVGKGGGGGGGEGGRGGRDGPVSGGAVARAAAAAGTRWNDPAMAELMGCGMGEFKRKVAEMGVAEKEDALLTLQMHAAGVKARLDVRSKRLLASAQRLQGATAGADEDEALVEAGPTFRVTEDAGAEDAAWDRMENGKDEGTDATATANNTEGSHAAKPQLREESMAGSGSKLRVMQQRLQLATGSKPSTRYQSVERDVKREEGRVYKR